MRKISRSSQPGGERQRRNPNQSGERTQRFQSSGKGYGDRGAHSSDSRPGRRSPDTERSAGRGGFRRDNRFDEQRGAPRYRGEDSGYSGRKRTSSDNYDGHKGHGSNPRKLLLKKERRPSKGELLRELGYADHKSYRESVRNATTSVPPAKSGLIRLNRFISNAGICSRREADKYIAAGVVKVNGQVVTELGTKVSPDDEVRFDDRVITPERKVYLLLNKPKDYVTTTDDPNAVQTVMDLVKNACEERIYPVGRLDRNTTGLLLFTNDGDMAKRLSHPSHKIEKVYQVTLDKSVSASDLKKIADGIELEDGLIAADAVSYVEGMEKNVIGIEIHSGRNRIVRRIFEHLGYKVKALDRVSYAGLTKKNLPRGKWRFLSPPEVSFLKMK